ncbi:Phage-related minor tail protein [Yersinia intermedia]|uniref:tape measure protein n=1 Tax=Yersinia intermedia TaxID=631 RepID=UPI0005E9AB2B|nr:tape measure protein [Yersinia intermedia]CNJ80513.1 Phage-related minor tail protein [Yersinia intermedia]
MASEQQLGNIVYQVEMEVGKLITSQQQVNSRLDQMEGKFNSTAKSVDRAEKSFLSLSRVATALSAAISVQQITAYGNAWVTVSNKLVNAVRANEDLFTVTNRVFDISQDTRAGLEATATLYGRLEMATRSAGTSTADLAKLTTTINKGLVVSGATAEEASSTMIQLSQALASGVLRGEEFNSISENGSRLAVALADSLGVTVGQLRAMAAEGKLTTDVVVNGLLKQSDAIAKEFGNTVLTMGQAFTVASNNITKFVGESSSVNTTLNVFNSSVISLSENLDSIATVIGVVAAIIGSRYVAALTLASAAQVQKASSARQAALADNLSAQAAANQSAANLIAAQSAKTRAIEEITLAQMQKASAFNATNSTAAEVRLSAARLEAATATGNYNRALAANVLAQKQAAAAASAASISGGLLRGALSLVGGPVGAATLAAGAIFYFYQKAQEAKKEANELADGVSALVGKMKEMSNVQLGAEIAKLNSSMPILNKSLAEAQAAYDNAAYSVSNYTKVIKDYGLNTTTGRQAAEALTGAQDRLAIAANELSIAQNRVDKTQSAVNIGHATLNGTVLQGIDLLKRDGHEAGVVAGMMNKLGQAINIASGAKERFNSTSLSIQRDPKAQKVLDDLYQQNELLAETDLRKRAQLKTEQELRAINADDNTIRIGREQAGVAYDKQAAQAALKKEIAATTKEENKAAAENARRVKQLQELQSGTEALILTEQRRYREAALADAVSKLGKDATAAQIKEAQDLAGQEFDIKQRINDRKAASDINYYAAADLKRKDDLDQTDRMLKAELITFEQAQARKAQIAVDYQKSIAEATASKAVTPQQELSGLVDPVQALANEHAKKLALIQQFETQKGVITANGLALMNAANTQYEQARIAVQWEIFRNQSVGNESLAAAFDSLAGNASNAFTGIITQSMTAEEAMRSLASNAVNSLINGFVQMGVEWVKSAITGSTAQVAATATTTAAAVAGTATTTAASVSSAAATTTAWTPAAIVASIGSFGGAAAIGIGAVVAAMALSGSLSGKRKNGGPVSAGSMYQVGEGGMPEIYQAGTGKQYMIPGDNGKVISNKDMQGSGSAPNVSIQFIDQSTGRKSFDAQSSMSGNNLTVTAFISDLEEGGPMSQSITRNTTASRRANG